MDAKLDDYLIERKIFQATTSNERNVLVENIVCELWKAPFVLENFESGINLKHLLRQACDMTLLTEIELVLLKQVALAFVHASSVSGHTRNASSKLPLSYHDVQLFLVCLCVATREHAFERKDSS